MYTPHIIAVLVAGFLFCLGGWMTERAYSRGLERRMAVLDTASKVEQDEETNP